MLRLYHAYVTEVLVAIPWEWREIRLYEHVLATTTIQEFGGAYYYACENNLWEFQPFRLLLSYMVNYWQRRLPASTSHYRHLTTSTACFYEPPSTPDNVDCLPLRATIDTYPAASLHFHSFSTIPPPLPPAYAY